MKIRSMQKEDELSGICISSQLLVTASIMEPSWDLVSFLHQLLDCIKTT